MTTNLRAELLRALCTDHGHDRREGGMSCRTCLRRVDTLLPIIAADREQLTQPLLALAAQADTKGSVLGLVEEMELVGLAYCGMAHRIREILAAHQETP